MPRFTEPPAYRLLGRLNEPSVGFARFEIVAAITCFTFFLVILMGIALAWPGVLWFFFCCATLAVDGYELNRIRRNRKEIRKYL